MFWITASFYVLVFAFGACIGSFLNVCIYRIPAKEDIVKKSSHCLSCGYNLKWFDLIPIVSYLCLGGKCRKCGEKISPQYPLIETLNAVLYVITFMVKGANVESLLYCLLISALIALSVIDWRTYEIPVGFNIFIGCLGIVMTVLDRKEWLSHLIGAVCVSLFLLILYLATKGRGIGGGDIKLMAAAGLLLGYKEVIFAFALGCILGAIIHVIRMKVSGAGKVLAMGPYLSAGIIVSALWGTQLINLYISNLQI